MSSALRSGLEHNLDHLCPKELARRESFLQTATLDQAAKRLRGAKRGKVHVRPLTRIGLDGGDPGGQGPDFVF